MAEADRIAAALRYQQELDNAQRPAFGNPNMLAQGRKMNLPERQAYSAEAPDWMAKGLPMEGRATILPFRDTESKREIALPGLIANALNSMTAPGRAFSGSDPTFDPMSEGIDFALNTMGGGMTASKAAPVPAGSLGMFIGKTAKNWDSNAAIKALEMEKAGVDPKMIWQETGTWKSPDGQWRQEISDKGSKITEDVYKQISSNKEFKGPMEQALQHEELYKAYPETARIPTVMYADETPYGSVLRGKEGTFQVPQITVGGPSQMAQRSVGLHELQHTIQQREGFARGGNLNEYSTGPMFDKTARDLTADLSQVVTGGVSAKPLEVLQGLKYTDPKDIEPIIKKYGFKNIDEAKSFIYDENERRTPLGQYLRTAGEAEARATQKRRNMTTEERRAKFPVESYDVPINQLIIRQ